MDPDDEILIPQDRTMIERKVPILDTPVLPPWLPECDTQVLQHLSPGRESSWPTEQSDNKQSQSSHHSMDPDNEIFIPRRNTIMMIEREVPIPDTPVLQHLFPGRGGSWPTEQSNLDSMQGQSSHHSMDPDSQILIPQMPRPHPSIESEGPTLPPRRTKMGIVRVTPSQPLWPESDDSSSTEQSQPLDNEDRNKGLVEIIIDGLQTHNRSHDQIKPECSIFKAPLDISQFDSEAYMPKVIMIGPYHYRETYSWPTNDAYRDMQRCKWQCLGSLISRHEGTPADDLVSRCIAKMTSHHEQILSYYSKYDPNRMASRELAKLMVLDGCFILQILLDPNHFQERPHNRIIGRLWIWTLVRYDLLLLENQIPFFVLYELLDIIGVGDEKHVDLVSRALHYMGDACLPRTPNFSPPKRHQILHLLHLFYMSLLPVDLSTAPPADIIWIPCATELTDFGIKFLENNGAKSFLDVNFSRKGVMEVPPLLIDDHSKDLLRNLIAFEQCYPNTGCHISVYTSFMECIMNSEKDVRLLHLEGILVNRMSADQDITHFFSNLCKGVHIARDRFYLATLFANVTEYKDDTFNKCLGEFKQTYCNNSWAVFAAVLSAFFAVLTIVQTFYGFYPYYYPRN